MTEPDEIPYNPLSVRWTAFVFAACAGVYGATAARDLIPGDAAEFALVAGTGGYAHPPGYPLYSLYLWATNSLPISSVAHEAALATALLGALASALLYAALRAWDVPPFAALFGVALFGFAPEIWFLHTVPEAFALNHVVLASLLWLSAPRGPLTGGSRVAGLGIVAAVAVAHHHMAAFAFPVGFYGLYRGIRESDRHPAALVALGAAALATGFVPYLHLAWVTEFAPDAYHWGEVRSVGDALEIVLRRDYGTLQVTSGGRRVGPFTQIGTLATESTRDLHYLPVLLAPAGLYRLWRRASRGVRGADGLAAAAVVGTWLTSGPLFVALIGRGVSGTDYLHLRKFHAQFELLTAFLCGVGAAWLAGKLTSRWLRALLLSALVAAGAARAHSYLRVHRGPTLEQYVRDTLAPLPERAVVLGDSDHRYFGFEYAERVWQLRTDVRYVDVNLAESEWYRSRIEGELEGELPMQRGRLQVGTLVRSLHERDLPVFVSHLFHPYLARLGRLYPVGTGYRILAPDRTPPPLVDVYRRNLEWMRSATIEARPGVPPTSWNRLILSQYGSNWRELADELRRAGHRRHASRARQIADRLAPWPTRDRPPTAER